MPRENVALQRLLQLRASRDPLTYRSSGRFMVLCLFVDVVGGWSRRAR